MRGGVLHAGDRVTLAPQPVMAQSAGGGMPMRTPDGQPVISGVFTFRTLTPLQRPTQFEGKETLTAAEAAEFEASERRRQIWGANCVRNDMLGKPLSDFGLSRAVCVCRPDSAARPLASMPECWSASRGTCSCIWSSATSPTPSRGLGPSARSCGPLPWEPSPETMMEGLNPFQVFNDFTVRPIVHIEGAVPVLEGGRWDGDG